MQQNLNINHAGNNFYNKTLLKLITSVHAKQTFLAVNGQNYL